MLLLFEVEENQWLKEDSVQEVSEVLHLLFQEVSQGQSHGGALALHGLKLPYATTGRRHDCCGWSVVHICACVRYATEYDADGIARWVTIHNDASLSATAREYD